MRFDVSKHLIYRIIQEKGKTKVWEIRNVMADCRIGVVKWYPSWRHYCFFPSVDSVFSDRCLLSIGQFVERQNKNHK